MEILFYTVVALSVIVLPSKLVESIESRALEEVLGHSSPHVMPDRPINVNFSNDFTCFIFDPVSRELTTVVEERNLWADRRRMWVHDSNKRLLLNDANVLTISSTLIWKPDVQLYNRIKQSDRDHHAMARLYNDGMVSWYSMVIHHTLCSKDDTILEQDNNILYVAKCRLKFGPWMHIKNELSLSPLSDSYHSLRHYDPNCAKVGGMTSVVKETYSSAMIYYDIDVIVREEVKAAEEVVEPEVIPTTVDAPEAISLPLVSVGSCWRMSLLKQWLTGLSVVWLFGQSYREI